MGLKVGVFGIFLVTEITVIHQVHMSLHLLRSWYEDKKKQNKTQGKQRLWMYFCVIVFVCMAGRNLKTSNLSSAAVKTIAHGAVFKV